MQKKRAVLYARFSIDLQNDRSVDDQLEVCRAFATQNEFEVVEEYFDRAKSGTTMHGRTGLHSLIRDSKEGKFDVVVVEALDRLSRDQEDLAGIHKRLIFLGIDTIAVHDGKADAIQIGIRGLVSSLFITDLKHKVRRGMSGVVRDGRHPGGRAYGYRPTPGKPGVLQINGQEAKTVRRIFAEFCEGRHPREIARGLNTDGIVSPRGKKWNASTINGNKGRAYGILQNPIYNGRIVWNRVHMVRDPDTGKRISRANPPSEWHVAEAPHLALVDRETFEEAQRIKETRAHASAPHIRHRKRLLSGLLKCGYCGGGMTMHDRRGDIFRIRCSTNRESGTCSNTRRYRLDKIEKAVIDGMQERLDNLDSIAVFIESYQAERRSEAKSRAKIENEIAKNKLTMHRLFDKLIDELITDEYCSDHVEPLKVEIARLEAALEAAPAPNIVTLHPCAIAAYRDAMRHLSAIMPALDPQKDAELITAFRNLIDRIVVIDSQDNGVEVKVYGHLAPLIGEDAGDTWGVAVVAGEGLEPPTRGL